MADYHQRTWKKRYARNKETLKQRTRDKWAKQRAINLPLYGTSQSPKQLAIVREKVRVKMAENKKRYGIVTTPEQLRKHNERFLRLRHKAIDLYGGKCECCGESRYEMLTFDHKEKVYHKDKIRGVKLVYDVIRKHEEQGYPNNVYQLLCWNCNMSKGFYDYCPHIEHNRKLPSKLKQQVIEHYGGRCALCGEDRWEFLTIDHINGGGTEHRRKLNNSVYAWLRKSGWPTDGFRLLCSNCNCSQKHNRWNRKMKVEA